MNWNCSSISSSSLSICSQMQSHNFKFLQQNGLLFKEPKLMISPHLRKKLHFLPNSQSKIHSTQLSNLSSLHIQTPISKPLKVHSSYNNLPNNIFKATVEKVAILLVGGIFFMGSFGCKPALASPTEEKTILSEPLEEIKDTQSENSDDELYLKILENNPRDIDALKVAFSRMMMKGKRKEAVKYVERLIEVQPDEVEWRLLQALSYEMMGNLTRAKRLFKEILQEKPLLIRALHGLAMVMHKNREGPAVFEMLNKALELAQREKRVAQERNIRILIAQMHVVNGDLEEGLKKFNDLVNDNPTDFRPYLCQGIIYSLLNKKKEADEQFEIYRSLVPQEFPQRGFLDDVVLAAKTETREQLEKEFEAAFSYKKMKTN